MMLSIAFAIGALLFLKVVWNMLVAYSLMLNPTKPDGSPRGVSMMPAIEIALLIAGTLAVWLSAPKAPWHWWVISLIALGAIIASYLHFLFVGLIAGLVLRKFPRKP